MKKYGKYEFEPDSTFGELDLKTELYGSRLNDIALAEQDFQDATNEKEKQSAISEKNNSIEQQKSIEAAIEKIIEELGYDVVADFLSEKCKAMETIINNPTPETAAKYGMYAGLFERTLFTDEKVIKRIATRNLSGSEAIIKYIQTTHDKNL